VKKLIVVALTVRRKRAGRHLSVAAHHNRRTVPGWRADRHGGAHPGRADDGDTRPIREMSMTSAELRKSIAAETEKWAKVIRAANIKVE
jgi:hypothetical protein